MTRLHFEGASQNLASSLVGEGVVQETGGLQDPCASHKRTRRVKRLHKTTVATIKGFCTEVNKVVPECSVLSGKIKIGSANSSGIH